LAASRTGFNGKLNSMREYLQAYISRILRDAGFFRGAAFVGGTALRFLYDLPRFSEDMDFSSMTKERVPSFVELIEKIDRELKAAGYTVKTTHKSEKTVQNAMIKFEGLLFEAGLSPLPKQNFSIKIDLDTRPPEGAIVRTQVVNKFFPVSFLAYDTSSLFAGKLHALLTRQYVKGRDFFDLGWYLSRWKNIVPNIILLRNALTQTGWSHTMPSEKNWRPFVRNVVEKVDWKSVRKDVESFLENPSDMDIFTKENVINLLAEE